jgi:hypothetical protein
MRGMMWESNVGLIEWIKSLFSGVSGMNACIRKQAAFSKHGMELKHSVSMRSFRKNSESLCSSRHRYCFLTKKNGLLYSLVLRL